MILIMGFHFVESVIYGQKETPKNLENGLVKTNMKNCGKKQTKNHSNLGVKMKIKLKTLEQLMIDYGFSDIQIEDNVIQKICINGTYIRKRLKYLGEIINTGFIGGNYYFPKWMVEEVIEETKEKFKKIKDFEEFYGLIGTGNLYFSYRNRSKHISGLEIGDKDHILIQWRMMEFVYYKKVKEQK